jgi:membrane-associated phospholipid phosphatase
MNALRRFLRPLRPVDTLIALFLVAITAAYLFAANSPLEFLAYVALNAAIIAAVRAAAAAASRPKALQIIFDFYPVPMILLIFKEVHVLIQSMTRGDLDHALIAIDRALFGVDPTVWIMQFATPVLTEILQLAYVSYYVLMLLVGVELYRRSDRGPFSLAIFAILYGFLLSYIGYIAFPAVGPRFTLHDFNTLNDELPGLWFSSAIRDFINTGESIPKGAANALALAQRDAFPSGHTQMTLISMFYAAKYSIRSRYFIYVAGTLLIISTVYLRYHYVVDLLGGTAFMLFTVWSAPKLMRALERITKGA